MGGKKDQNAYPDELRYENAGPKNGEDTYDASAEEDVVYDDDFDDYDDRRRGGIWFTVLYILLVMVVSVALAIGMWFAADDVLALTKADNEISITIQEEDTLSDIADNLKNHGLIRYKTLFLLYGRVSGAEDKISSGTFVLNQQFDYHALVNSMSSASEARATVTLTFPEGYTCDQIFQMLAENDVCSLEELQDAAANYNFEYAFLDEIPYGADNRLEGFLFPDTYEFYVDDDAVRVINKFLSNFSDRVTDDMLDAIDDLNDSIRTRMEQEGTFTQEEIEDSMMDLYDILTVASLIEREAGADSERSAISSVIYNRLTTHVHELLQIDATVEYALGEHRTELTAEDLAIDSPYNTYLYEGLPPGPIANPGLASIRAAIYPADTDYFFYALDGSTHRFFKTYIEQEAFLNGEELDVADSETEDENMQDTETPYEQIPITEEE